jgi:osmotically-inducible protein OsmY
MRIAYLLLVVLVSGLLQGCVPAAVGSGVMMVQDRRTSGAYVEDIAIEAKAFDRIGKQFKDGVHINITSFNRNVLISGEVPTDAIKTEVGRLMTSIENVRNINNELVVSGTTSLTARSNDSMITSNVKMRFVNDPRFSANHVKVITENGKVFLMGMVNRAEADAAAEVASTTAGVQGVVKLFEYLD